MFRHTYISARIRTTDHGQPVAPFNVATEVGHRSTQMIECVYGHLGDFRHRNEVVEYRIENHREKLGERAMTLRNANRT